MANLEHTNNPITELLTKKCELAEKQFVETSPISQEAIEYNDRLANFWHPGIKTRSQELEESERKIFVDMALSAWLNSRRGPERRGNRALVIDLGGGNGKVVDWIDALAAQSPHPVTYLYTDISPQMRADARARFEEMRKKHPGKKLRGHFPLADATKPLFDAREWGRIRSHFFPIISVCAGGTIGNFGELGAEDNTAQKIVFKLLLEGPDATLVTFLDPARIERSLKAYSTFGTASGMYDAQDIRLFVAGQEADKLHHECRVPFEKAKLDKAINGLAQVVRDLGPEACWARLEMLKSGESVGQVTRHYNQQYVHGKFLNGSSIFATQPCDRARIFACAGAV